MINMRNKEQETNEFSQSKKLFQEIITAINQNNEKKIVEITKQHCLSDYSDLPFLIDENGDAIAHHVCKRGNLNVARYLFNESLDRFRLSFYIENKENKRPLECNSNENNDDLKKRLHSRFLSMQPSFCQKWILDQFRLYLHYQLVNKPKEYSFNLVNKICNLLETGHCFGFSSLWAQSCLQGKHEVFINLFRDIIIWDRKNNSLSKALCIKFETAISLIRAHQELPFEIENQKKQADILRNQGMFSDYLEKAKDFKYLQREKIDYNTLELKVKPPNQYEIVKNWGANQYQCESNLMLYPPDINDIVDYFKHFCIPQNNKKALIIYAEKHYAACYFANSTIYYYDSNYEFSTTTSDKCDQQPIGKIIAINHSDDIEKIVSLINKSFFEKREGKKEEFSFDWGDLNYPIHIRALDLTGKKLGQYPTKELLESIWNNKKQVASYNLVLM